MRKKKIAGTAKKPNGRRNLGQDRVAKTVPENVIRNAPPVPMQNFVHRYILITVIHSTFQPSKIPAGEGIQDKKFLGVKYWREFLTAVLTINIDNPPAAVRHPSSTLCRPAEGERGERLAEIFSCGILEHRSAVLYVKLTMYIIGSYF